MATEGHVSGLVNYHPIDMQSKEVVRAAVIDLIAFGDVPPSEKVRLVRAVLREMASEGIKLVLLLALPGLPRRALLLSGFVPRPRQNDLLCVRMDEDFDVGKPRRAHVLWR